MPSAPPFVHLHCHSHYSLLDGASRLPELTRRARALGMEALALTDHGNMYGAVELLRESKAAGIKPIVGMEAYVAPRHRAEKARGGVLGKKVYFHLTLLARTGEGFRNLMRLSSAAFLEGYYYRPRIDHEILERHAEGLTVLTGCVASEYSDFILNDRPAEAERLIAWYQKIFGPEHVYVEIQNNGYSVQAEHLERSVDFARRRGLPLVATSDAHYLTREDAESHDVLLCVNEGKTVDDPSRLKFDTQEYYVRSPDEMLAAMPGFDEALGLTNRIAESVEPNYESVGLGRRCFPAFEPPPSKTPDSYLRELCEAGLRERYGDPPPPEAVERLEHELGIIQRMGFSAYFLIVWDFVRHAGEQGIPASARGSACGAIVSYVLKLSHVCPLKYDLLFERFLDPNRSEAPDIDIDLCQDRRYEVIEYVRAKYGAENVAQIGTFGTLKAKAAITDVGRALGIPLARVEAVKKLVPNVLNISLEEALKKEPALRAERRARRRRREAPRLLDPARGDDPQRRHARRRRRDRRPPAPRPLPAPEAAEQGQEQGGRLDPVGHGGRREGRPPEGRLPRAPEPDDAGRRCPDDPRAAPGGQPRPRRPAAGRRADLRAAPAGRDEGRLPARIGRHPRPPDQDEAGPLRRHHRHQRPLPAGPAQRRDGRQLRQPQARPRRRPSIRIRS